MDHGSCRPVGRSLFEVLDEIGDIDRIEFSADLDQGEALPRADRFRPQSEPGPVESIEVDFEEPVVE